MLCRNAPYVFGIRSAATAIATGNTTVLKSSELTPRCYWAIGKAFKEAGLPDGIFNVIGCKPQDAALIVNTMIDHPAVRKVNFTGSAATGRKVARVCGDNLKPILMELGGKNSAIVLEDADLEKAAGECIAGAFLNVREVPRLGSWHCGPTSIDQSAFSNGQSFVESVPRLTLHRQARYAWAPTVSLSIAQSRRSCWRS